EEYEARKSELTRIALPESHAACTNCAGLRARDGHQGLRLGVLLAHVWLGAVRPVLYAMLGDRAQDNRGDTLSSGRGRLRQLAVKGSQSLTRPCRLTCRGTADR